MRSAPWRGPPPPSGSLPGAWRPRSERPTPDDLHRLVRRGVPVVPVHGAPISRRRALRADDGRLRVRDPPRQSAGWVFAPDLRRGSARPLPGAAAAAAAILATPALRGCAELADGAHRLAGPAVRD